MNTAEDRTIIFDTMANDAGGAVLALRRQPIDRALKAIKYVLIAIVSNEHGFVILVATVLAALVNICHCVLQEGSNSPQKPHVASSFSTFKSNLSCVG